MAGSAWAPCSQGAGHCAYSGICLTATYRSRGAARRSMAGGGRVPVYATSLSGVTRERPRTTGRQLESGRGPVYRYARGTRAPSDEGAVNVGVTSPARSANGAPSSTNLPVHETISRSTVQLSEMFSVELFQKCSELGTVSSNSHASPPGWHTPASPTCSSKMFIV
jgi:hypothetical protein